MEFKDQLKTMIDKISERALSPEGRQRYEEMECAEKFLKKTDSWSKQLPKKFGDNFQAGMIEEKRVHPVAKKYVNDKAWEKEKWCWIIGKRSGEGKSHDIAWILAKMPRPSFMWAVTPIDIIDARWDNQYLYNQFVFNAILVLDDFDHSNNSKDGEGERRVIFQNLLAHRDYNKLITFGTANHDWNGLCEIWSEPIVRRIVENCGEYIGVK